MEPITDAHGSGSGFNMQLELEQLQAKVRLLAGGTDGEQLAEVLLDREEELRSKEGEILELRRKLQSMSSDIVAFEADRTEYEGMIQELDQQLKDANDQLRMAKENKEAMQVERSGLEQLLRNEQEANSGLKGQLHQSTSAKDACERDLSALRMELDAEQVARRTDVTSLETKLQEALVLEETLRSEVTELEQRKEDIVLRSRAIQDEMTAELATEKESHLLAAEKVKSLEFEVESLRHNLADAKAHLEQSESSRVSSEREAAELATKLGFSEEKLKARETDVEALRLEKVNAAQTLAELRTQMEVQQRARKTIEQQGTCSTEATSEVEAALRAELKIVQKQLAPATERRKEPISAPSTSAANVQGSTQGHAEEIARIRATNEFLVEELNQLRLASSEATQLKQQNTELRAKVIRQDAAWKRKIESERRRGHIVDFGKTGKSLPLGNCSDSANIALNREDRPKSKDSVRASRRGDESKSGQMARSQDLENADGKAWL